VKVVEADLAVIGSGVCGLLAAWAPLQSGATVAMLERGALKTHAEQLADGEWSADVPGAQPNNETAPGTLSYPWSYVYGVGGSSLHWSGTTPRFKAADFAMRSTYGVMRDWPISLEQLLPYYRRAEQALGIAGAPEEAEPAAGPPLPGAKTLPPHPHSPMDEVVGPHLEPFGPLPQARPSQPLQGRPACCGSATCELCPVDARFSALNGLQVVLGHPGLDLHRQTVAARLRRDPSGRSIEAIEAIAPDGTHMLVRAQRYVLAANGFENPGILLRSGLQRADVGHYLSDHGHTSLFATLRRAVRPGYGSTLVTGLSEAFRDGPFRSRYAAAIVSLYNPGVPLGPFVADGISAGNDGDEVRARALAAWKRILPLDMLSEDVPQRARRVSLSPRRDSFGLPLNRIAYSEPSRYERDGIAHVVESLRRRLAPLGVSEVTAKPGPRGGHLLGTCRMGDGDEGVVDDQLRHLDFENLFVAGGSAFPTYGPVHPTLTVAALALRLGQLLAGELSPSSGAGRAAGAARRG
jgi:choline dehydrogenase-like flavoprotein